PERPVAVAEVHCPDTEVALADADEVELAVVVEVARRHAYGIVIDNIELAVAGLGECPVAGPQLGREAEGWGVVDPPILRVAIGDGKVRLAVGVEVRHR